MCEDKTIDNRVYIARQGFLDGEQISKNRDLSCSRSCLRSNFIPPCAAADDPENHVQMVELS